MAAPRPGRCSVGTRVPRQGRSPVLPAEGSWELWEGQEREPYKAEAVLMVPQGSLPATPEAPKNPAQEIQVTLAGGAC